MRSLGKNVSIDSLLTVNPIVIYLAVAF
uniref:Uncharacterized protein n=1 Tax=Anguilla anguilla TaxID=7936 RepID=A0A0E9VBT4_ANGAN